MIPKILLVNPPIYDFTAYDFWLKPYGLLSIAGYLRGKADFKLFDYLDRLHHFTAEQDKFKSDRWGRGRFYFEKIPSPACLLEIPRHFRRFGLPRSIFEDFLKQQQPCDFAFIQTTMTYWYQGVREVIDDIRRAWPDTKIILGGNYATICSGHAQKLGADFLVRGTNLEPLWKYLNLTADMRQPANITAYQILGHPAIDIQQLEDSMRFANSIGIRGMLADFSPIPGTPDGEYCRRWVDMDEPLFHNKTAFPIILLGFAETNRLKELQRNLNRQIS